MQSPETIREIWIDGHQAALSDFSAQIESCIINSDWERLATVLETRQQYLEQLLANPIPEGFLDAVKQLSESILDEDAGFLRRIQEQKNISAQQQTSLERGRQAIRAYNDNI